MKPKKIPQAAQAAMMAVIDRESAIKAFDLLIQGGRNEFGQYHFSKSEVDAVDILRAWLYRRLAEAHRNLLMWLHISPESLPEETRSVVVSKYVGAGKEIMSALRRDLSLPGSYRCEEHDQFRDEIDEWIKANMPKTKAE